MIAAKRHPRWDQLGPGAQKLMVRNVHQILGEDPNDPAAVDLVICWTEAGRGSGGTGMALRIAADHRIPVVDLGADRSRIDRALDHAVRHGLPETTAKLIAPTHAPTTVPGHRIVVAGESQPPDRPAIETHLAKLAAEHTVLIIVPAGQTAATTAATWANANGHRVAYPSPPPGPDKEPRSARAARILDPRPDLVLDCRTDWDANVQSLVDTAEMDHIPVSRCSGIARRATSIEHALDHAAAERRQPGKAPHAPAHNLLKKPTGPYAQVDTHAVHQLRLDAESSRIARAAARRHRLTDPQLLDRALFVANSPDKETQQRLLQADSWTTQDRLEHDPLGTLTAGIDPPALRQVLAAARTIRNALARAKLERAASIAPEPDNLGTRQKLVARERHLIR